MKAVNAGVIVELVANDLDPDRLGDEELVAPHFIDSEVTNVLRRLVTQEILTDKQGTAALHGFTQLTLTRFPADWLRPRMWKLRHDLSTYDATYVALAEAIGATAVLTTDTQLANAPGLRCAIELLEPRCVSSHNSPGSPTPWARSQDLSAGSQQADTSSSTGPAANAASPATAQLPHGL